MWFANLFQTLHFPILEFPLGSFYHFSFSAKNCCLSIHFIPFISSVRFWWKKEVVLQVSLKWSQQPPGACTCPAGMDALCPMTWWSPIPSAVWWIQCQQSFQSFCSSVWVCSKAAALGLVSGWGSGLCRTNSFGWFMWNAVTLTQGQVSCGIFHIPDLINQNNQVAAQRKEFTWGLKNCNLGDPDSGNLWRVFREENQGPLKTKSHEAFLFKVAWSDPGRSWNTLLLKGPQVVLGPGPGN